MRFENNVFNETSDTQITDVRPLLVIKRYFVNKNQDSTVKEILVSLRERAET